MEHIQYPSKESSFIRLCCYTGYPNENFGRFGFNKGVLESTKVKGPLDRIESAFLPSRFGPPVNVSAKCISVESCTVSVHKSGHPIRC